MGLDLVGAHVVSGIALLATILVIAKPWMVAERIGSRSRRGRRG